jgi:hypothetical protein
MRLDLMRCSLTILLALAVASCDAVDPRTDGLPPAEVLAEALELLRQNIPEGVRLDSSLMLGPDELANAESSLSERLGEAMALSGIESGDGRAAQACAQWTSSRGVPIEEVIQTPPPPGCEEGMLAVFVVALESNDEGQAILRSVGWSREWQHEVQVVLGGRGPEVLSSRAHYLIQ